MDIFGPVTQTSDKYKYILVLVDSFSKWCELVPLKTQEASEIAWALYSTILIRFGAPHQLVSDRGQIFFIKGCASLLSVV